MSPRYRYAIEEFCQHKLEVVSESYLDLKIWEQKNLIFCLKNLKNHTLTVFETYKKNILRAYKHKTVLVL